MAFEKNILNLAYETLIEIFYFLSPDEKLTPLHHQFRELKFVSKDFYNVYCLYFSIYGTKYFLVKSYNPYRNPAIQTIPFNIRYTKKNIWIDFEYNEGKKWNYCHLQQDSHKKFFCDIQFLSKKNKSADRYLNLIDTKDFKTYKKSECMRCKKNTYCVIEKYFTKEGSHFNRMLKKMNNHFITVIFSAVYQKICINTCTDCKEYLDYHSELESTYLV